MENENGWDAVTRKANERLEERRIELYGKLTLGELLNKCEYSKTCTIYALNSFSCHHDSSFCGTWKTRTVRSATYGKQERKRRIEMTDTEKQTQIVQIKKIINHPKKV